VLAYAAVELPSVRISVGALDSSAGTEASTTYLPGGPLMRYSPRSSVFAAHPQTERLRIRRQDCTDADALYGVAEFIYDSARDGGFGRHDEFEAGILFAWPECDRRAGRRVFIRQIDEASLPQSDRIGAGPDVADRIMAGASLMAP